MAGYSKTLKREVKIAVNKVLLDGTLYIPSSRGPFPTVMVVHGFLGHRLAPLQVALANQLARKGFFVLAFNFSYDAHNPDRFRKLTITREIKELKGAIDYVKRMKQYDGRGLSIIGHSLGGLVALLTSASSRDVARLVLQSPFVKLRRRFLFGIHILRWKHSGTLKFFSKKLGRYYNLDYKFYSDCANYKPFAAASKIKIPVLIIHGDKDKSIALSGSRKLVKKFKFGELKIVKNGSHLFLEHLDEVAALTSDWLTKNL